MNNFLPLVVTLLFFVIVFDAINRKFFNFSYEIALMFFATIVGGIYLAGSSFFLDTSIFNTLKRLQPINIESFLMDGALCFMLFAGSCHLRISDFLKQARPVGIYSFLATFLAAVFYGFAFYGLSLLCKLSLTLPECLMLGSIVSPTDPIAATSILNKFGLPKKTGFLIEAESLLNDGVGVAVFVCFSGMVIANATPDKTVFSVLIQQIAGATAIGASVTFVCLNLMRKENDFNQKIYISLLCVSLSYLLCQYYDCSGAIACVVCGVMFSNWREKQSEEVNASFVNFDICWQAIDHLLNSVLYVIMGLSMLMIMRMNAVVMICLATVLCNFIGRGGSVYLCSFFLKEIPDGFSRNAFTFLLTWGGLRGGLCIALAMSTQDMVSEEHFQYIMGATYALVFFTTVVQGLSLKKFYGYIKKP